MRSLPNFLRTTLYGNKLLHRKIRIYFQKYLQKESTDYRGRKHANEHSLHTKLIIKGNRYASQILRGYSYKVAK